MDPRVSYLERVRVLHARHLTGASRRARTAIAPPAGSYLWSLLSDLGARRVLDLGSGFSTWVIRAWAHEVAEHDVECWTSDHLNKWLALTESEISMQGWDTHHFYLWDSFKMLVEGRTLWQYYWDVVFVDIGSGEMRREAFPVYHNLAKVLVFDDWQFSHVRDSCGQMAEDAGFIVRSLPETEDEFGRYMAIAVLPNA